MCRARSKRTMNWTPAMNGVAATTSSEVERFAQTSSGMRQNVMPGARMVMIVTRKFSAVAIDDAPANCTPEVEERLAQRRPGGQRRVAGPAGVEGAAGDDEAGQEEQAGHRQHPERERVQARERHVRRPDHQRQDVVRDPGEDRDHEDEDHQRRVGREEAVVEARVDDLRAGLGELGADQHRDQPTAEEEEEGRDDVLDPDHLVIGVELEVVPPRLGPVLGVVLGPRRRSAAQRNQ